MGRFYSNDLERGIQLLYFQADHSKYSEGVSLIRRATEAGEADAYYFLARCYGWEDGDVQNDDRKAEELSLKGIQNNSALCVLGAERMDIFKGKLKASSPYTLKQAFDEVEKMAQAGEPMAQYAVGLFYFWGDMLLEIQKPNDREEFIRLERENREKAAQWFRASANQGCIPSFRNLFCGFRDGKYGVRDSKMALRIAEEFDTKVDCREFYCDIASEYQEIKEYDKAISWYEKGIAKGVASCADSLGSDYYEGRGGLKQDHKKAFNLFEKAIELGSISAYYNIGRCYFWGYGTLMDKKKAFEWILKAASQGKARDWYLKYAKYFLGWMYLDGIGTPVNDEEAFRYSREAVKEGSKQAKLYLGRCYLEGRGTAKDFHLGKQLMEECAKETGMSKATRYLGVIYDQGLGVDEDIAKAVSYYQKALEGGYPEAEQDLNRFKKTIFGKWKRR
mgnify:CR=1 FL=1